MAIGEVFLGAILAVLFEKLASPHVREFLKRLKIRPRLQKLESRLSETQQLLGDAENKQIKSELAKNWLGSLRDWAYDAEDLLDEFATKSMQFQLKRAAHVVDMGRCSKVVRALISFLVSNVIFMGYRLRAAGKIDKICARLDDFYAQEARLGLVVGVKDAGDTWQRTPTSSVDPHPSLYGRADVEKQIIDLLGIETGQGSSGANNLDVVAIVGMGGIGKTSLARHVFNHASVQKHFQLKGWVCVSSQFDVAKATKAILEEFQVNIGEVSQLNALQTKLKDKLAEEKKNFLLVLDDVCFTSSDDWHSLRAPLKAVALPGSKVIVTTRHETAASMMCTIKPFILEGLSDADCLSVFRQHAFENDPSTSYPDVEPFHPKILEKCKGLPLAARELGVLLRGIQPDYWDVTLNSDILGLPEAAEGGISPTLWVSYHHLPSQLKRCFSYCSVLPKSYQFGEEEIVLLWMAEGLIADQRWVDMEDLGGAYFRELLSRSLFRYANDHKSRFVMDDGVNELARLVAGKSCVNLEDDHNKNGSFENARHVSYSQNFICEKCENMKSLRAVLPFTASYGSYSFLPFTASYGDYDFLPFTASHGDYGLLLKLLPKLKFLRALGLRGFDVGELPKEIGELIHLRYMDLSYTAIIKLPESTCLIRNLQTLKLKCCWRLQTLPEDMRKLTSLRHLDLSLCGSLQSMPIGLDKLTCLRTISICVPGGGGDAITAVKNLVHLGNSLRRLELKWLNQRPGNDVSIPQDSSIALDVLDLQSHQGLEILNIQGFPGLAFSRWIAVSNVRVLTLQEIEACRNLPPLGKMPNLETLKIINFLSLSAVGKEFYGEGNSIAFPKLKSLRFQGMREWKEWWNPSSAGCFPHLGELHIRDCEKLVFDLPTQLPSLSRLHIKRCKKVLIRNATELRSLVSADALEIGGVEAMECFFTDDDWVDDRDAQLLYWLSKQVIPKVDLTELIYGALRADKHVWAHNVLHSLTSFTIRGIAQLSLLGAGAGAAGRILGELLKLKQLKIEKCENLCGCVWPLDSSLAGSTSADMLLLPTSLKELEIYCCEKLEFVAVDSSCSLEFLTIGECSLLSSITSSRGLLPASLRELRIQNCKKLEIVAASLPLDSSLELLVMSDCSSLTRLLKCADADLPASLRELDIQNCEKLEIVAASWLVDSSLEVLVISDCSSLRRLTSTDMVLPASLIELRIRNCKNLEIVASSWPMDSSSSSLGELEISNCSSLTRLTCTDIVLPASLIELRIRNCNKLEIVAAGWLVG